MGLANALEKEHEGAARENPAGGPSVTSSLEHLISGSQGVITKRVDLALLEAQEMMSRFIERAAMAGVAILLAAGTWFAAAGALVLVLAPNGDLVLRLGVFALINAAGTFGLIRIVQRHDVPIAVAQPDGAIESPASEASQPGPRN